MRRNEAGSKVELVLPEDLRAGGTVDLMWCEHRSFVLETGVQ
jgi:hypothetical protein